MMTKTAFPILSTRHFEKTLCEIALIRSREMWLVALFLSATFGLLAGIVGLGLSALLALRVIESVGHLKGEITILLAASFPLLFLSAHCLDRIREIETKVKLEYCKRLGFESGPSADSKNEK